MGYLNSILKTIGFNSNMNINNYFNYFGNKYNVNSIVLLFGFYFYLQKSNSGNYLKSKIYNFVKNISIVKSLIDSKVKKTINEVKKNFLLPNHDTITKIPIKGLKIDNIYKLQEDCKNLRNFDIDKGPISGTVYYGFNKEYSMFLMNSYHNFIFSNPLHPDVFPDIRVMESEVVNMVLDLFNGDKNCCGNVTSGGTESILLACKTYRDWGLDQKGITKPEIIVAESAHAAFFKAGHYFQIKIKVIPVDTNSGKIMISKLYDAINENTVAIVGSAPSYAHGVMDNINEMSKIAYDNDIGLHVDCCLGGFILPFLKRKGLLTESYDFRLKGVTSISADTHKYGYTLKGSSLIMYNNSNLRKYQYYIKSDWNGGIYATPIISGSRSGALIAVTWSSLLYHGLDGYSKIALEIVKLKNKIVNRCREIEDLIVIGDPISSVVAFNSYHFDIFIVATQMTEKNWNLNVLQYPNSFHICLTHIHVKNNIEDKFMNDLIECVNYAKTQPNSKKKGVSAIYGMAKQINDPTIVNDVATGYLDSLTELN